MPKESVSVVVKTECNQTKQRYVTPQDENILKYSMFLGKNKEKFKL